MVKKAIVYLVALVLFVGLTPAILAQEAAGADANADAGVSADEAAARDESEPTVEVEVEANADEESVTPEDLGVTSTGILPTNPFYFLKEWGRGFRRIATFDPVERAEFELKVANEKAAELLQVGELNPDREEALEKASQNYEAAMERLKERLERLSERSDNPKVDQLLDNLADRVSKHQGVFDNLSNKFQQFNRFRERVKNAQDKIDDAVRPVVEGIDDPEKFKERILRITEGEDGAKHRERLLNIVGRVGEKVGSPEVQGQLSEIKERIKERINDDGLGAAVGRKVLQNAEDLKNRVQMEAERAVGGIPGGLKSQLRDLGTSTFEGAGSALKEFKQRVEESHNRLKIEVKERDDGHVERRIEIRTEDKDDKANSGPGSVNSGRDDDRSEDEDSDDSVDADNSTGSAADAGVVSPSGVDNTTDAGI